MGKLLFDNEIGDKILRGRKYTLMASCRDELIKYKDEPHDEIELNARYEEQCDNIIDSLIAHGAPIHELILNKEIWAFREKELSVCVADEDELDNWIRQNMMSWK